MQALWRSVATVVAVALALGASIGARQNRSAIDVSGPWALTIDMSVGTASPTVDFKQDGEKLTGVYAGRYGDYPVSGTLKGKVISFSFTMRSADDPVVMTFTGEVASDGRTMKGKADMAEMGDADWTAERAPLKQP